MTLIAGCAANQPQFADFPVKPLWYKPSAVTSATESQLATQSEWQYNYPGATDRPPKIGLALSGGGTRAASFSIGVLKALQEKKLLPAIDQISTVSGGSYAALWYYTQNILQKDINSDETLNSMGLDYDTDTMFKVLSQQPHLTSGSSKSEHDALKSRFQINLENSSKIMMTHKGFGILEYPELAAKALVHIPTIPLHWVFNGIMDEETNGLNLFQWYYKNGLDRTYVLNPLDTEQDEYYNDPFRKCWLLNRLQAKDISFDTLKKRLDQLCSNPNPKPEEKSKRLPFWIINTSGWRGKKLDDWQYPDDENPDTDDRIFEFTALRAGSAQFGYWPLQDLWPNEIPMESPNLARAVSWSGAAIDGQQNGLAISGKRKPDKVGDVILGWLLNAMNWDLGAYLSNPNTPLWHRWLHSALPAPLWWLDDLTLSGLAPQNKTEFDRTKSKFDPANGRDDRFSTSILVNDGGKSENLGAYSLIRRGVENIIIVDAEHDPNSKYEGLRHLLYSVRNELGLEATDPDGNPTHDFVPCDKSVLPPQSTEWPNVKHLPPQAAVMCAQLRKLDGKENIAQDVKTIKLFYLKLSLDKELLKNPSNIDKYPYSVIDYANEHDQFPQESTIDIFYSPAQFTAYRDLGEFMGKRLAENLVCKVKESENVNRCIPYVSTRLKDF